MPKATSYPWSMMTDSYSGVGYYENFKPNGPQVDKEFNDHQYAVVNHDKPGMVTIKVCMHKGIEFYILC